MTRLVAVFNVEVDAVVTELPDARTDTAAREERLRDTGLEARQTIGVAVENGVDDVTHSGTGRGNGVEVGLRIAKLLSVFPVDVLRMVVARQAIDASLVERNDLFNDKVRFTFRDFDDVLRSLRATPAAVKNGAVPGFVREEQFAGFLVARFAIVLSERATTFTAVEKTLEGNHRFERAVELAERLHDAEVEAPVQGTPPFKAPVDRLRDFGSNDRASGDHREDLLILFVDILQVGLTVVASTATKREQDEIAEVVVVDEWAVGLADHVEFQSHFSLLG